MTRLSLGKEVSLTEAAYKEAGFKCSLWG